MNNHSSHVSRNNSMPPYCKLCQDAGKPESVYRSHCVRDRLGKTTCPYLLSLTCRRCNGSGHTHSHCPSTAVPRVVAPIRSYSKSPAVAPKNPEKKRRPSNGFAALADLSSDEESDADKSDVVAVAPPLDRPKHWKKQSLVNWCDDDSDNE